MKEVFSVRSTIVVHDLIGIFVHVAAVLRWPAGSVSLTTMAWDVKRAPATKQTP